MKTHSTVERVIYAFCLLLKKPEGLNKMLLLLQKNDIKINRETLLKYFKTFRAFGCKIVKREGKYRLLSVPFSLNLTKENFNSLVALENLAAHLFGDNIHQNFNVAMEKICRFSNLDEKNYKCALLAEHNEPKIRLKVRLQKIKELLKFDGENSKIQISYDGKAMKISDISFKYADNKVFVKAFSEKTQKYETLLLNKIRNIKPTPEVISNVLPAQSTVFELKGRLKEAYTLREGELVLRQDENRIVVSNNLEDKNELLKRLLRYGTMCKIILPKSDVESFKRMVKKMIKNLEK